MAEHWSFVTNRTKPGKVHGVKLELELDLIYDFTHSD